MTVAIITDSCKESMIATTMGVLCSECGVEKLGTADRNADEVVVRALCWLYVALGPVGVVVGVAGGVGGGFSAV